MFELSIFLRDHLIGRSVFDGEEVRIGRSADNEVQIDNLGVSRYHASIEIVGGLHVLKDFGSNAGTYVNGERVESKRALNDGDRIALGKFTLVFKAEKGAAAAVAAPEVRDEAAYAVAGQTIVARVAPPPEARERKCPWVAFLEGAPTGKERPPIHALNKDYVSIGSHPSNQIVVEKAPDRLAVVVRAWGGYSILSVAKGVKLNGSDADWIQPLKNKDELLLGNQRFWFMAGRPEATP